MTRRPLYQADAQTILERADFSADARACDTQGFGRACEEHTPAQIAAMGATQRSACFASESAAVQLRYLAIGLVVLGWATLILITRFPKATAASASGFQLRSFWRNSRFVLAVVAWFAGINLLLCAAAVVNLGHVGTYMLIASSFFMSIMFPTIFAVGVDGLGDSERKLGSALIVMAIIGGAILTAAMGAVSDAGGIQLAMSVPLLCFAVVLIFARRSRRETHDPQLTGGTSLH